MALDRSNKKYVIVTLLIAIMFFLLHCHNGNKLTKLETLEETRQSAAQQAAAAQQQQISELATQVKSMQAKISTRLDALAEIRPSSSERQRVEDVQDRMQENLIALQEQVELKQQGVEQLQAAQPAAVGQQQQSEEISDETDGGKPNAEECTNQPLLRTLKEIARKKLPKYPLFTSLVSQTRPGRIAEIGVWEGPFAKHMLQKNQAWLKTYYLVDPWRHLDDWNKPFNVDDDIFTRVYNKAMSQTKALFPNLVSVLRGTTLEVIDQVADNSLDLVYIDGDHTEEGCKTDLYNWYEKVRPGGLVTGDDFVDGQVVVVPNGIDIPRVDPTKVLTVVTAFCKEKGIELVDFGDKQFGFVKPC